MAYFIGERGEGDLAKRGKILRAFPGKRAAKVSGCTQGVCSGCVGFWNQAKGTGCFLWDPCNRNPGYRRFLLGKV